MRNSPKQYAEHRAAAGLPTLAPPPAVRQKQEILVRSDRLRREAETIRKVAAQSNTDLIARACLHRISSSILSDADALELVAESLGRR
jgi:hypothetical protein